MRKITREQAKNMIPGTAVGIVEDVQSGIRKKMNFNEFMNVHFTKAILCSFVSLNSKSWVRTITYWRGFHDGPSFKNGFYTDVVVEMKFNGRYVFSFHTVKKVFDNDKEKYVIPTKKNSEIL